MRGYERRMRGYVGISTPVHSIFASGCQRTWEKIPGSPVASETRTRAWGRGYPLPTNDNVCCHEVKLHPVRCPDIAIMIVIMSSFIHLHVVQYYLLCLGFPCKIVRFGLESSPGPHLRAGPDPGIDLEWNLGLRLMLSFSSHSMPPADAADTPRYWGETASHTRLCVSICVARIPFCGVGRGVFLHTKRGK